MQFQLRTDDEAVQEQMELGNLTKNDIDCMNNTTTPHIYPIAGGLAFAQIAFSLTKFKPGTRTIAKMFTRASIVGTAGITGTYAGHYVAGRVMRRNYNSLENQEGYKIAVKAIKDAQLAQRGQEVVAISWTYGIVIGQPIGQGDKQGQYVEESGSASQPDKDEQAFQTVRGDGFQSPRSPASNSVDHAFDNQSSPTSKPKPPTDSTRWDEIRGRNQSAQPTAWDLIRQRQERERLPPTSTSSTAPADDVFRSEAAPRSSDDAQSVFLDQGDPELSEQEKFDAMVEAERRMGGRSNDAYASWGDDKYSQNS
ncbi:hypothetical protein FRB95_009425 [Tulasnella sp. JGI-2019a]|nr:hypothetical protein FRB95_009425 [Tulasnella sp. JGI-2019a]